VSVRVRVRDRGVSVERLWRYRMVSDDERGEMLVLADRVCAMLTGLIRKHS
jgi:hypothetical protein